MAGYSATPLLTKLGIKSGYTLYVAHPPELYWEWLAPLPEGVRVAKKPSKEGIDFIHIFYHEKRKFEKEFLLCKKSLRKSGMLWVSWPKKSSGVVTDLDENTVRGFGLKNGLVDVKICAVDDVWSGLKFMYRVKDR
jgi:hypothetical protein